MIVQARALEVSVGKIESEGLNQMQDRARAGGEANGCTRVTWNPGLKENNVQHASRVVASAEAGFSGAAKYDALHLIREPLASVARGRP